MNIKVKNVTKVFNENTIIKDITYEFKTGNIYGLYGRNGSGKSVFLKLLSGFYLPTSGVILYDGKNYNENNEFPPSLRVLIEKPTFFPDMTGFENLKLLAKIQNKISDLEIEKALEIVNLLDQKDKKYSKYSLGMKQKLGIAQVIMEDPQIMFLDEPFNGIEQETVKKLLAYFTKIKKNKIIIISTHIKEDLDNLSDYIIYFDAGKIKD